MVFLCCSCLSRPFQLPHVNDASASLRMSQFGLAATVMSDFRVGRRGFQTAESTYGFALGCKFT